MIIDSHCHPYLNEKKDFSILIDNFKKNGGMQLISIGVDYESSQTCIQLSKDYDCIISSIGVHPCHIEFDGESIEEYLHILTKKPDLTEIVGIFKEMYPKNKDHIVAIGECGLDYYWLESISKSKNIPVEHIKNLQKYYFKAQILLAKKLGLPFIIHNREAGNDIFDILKECNYGRFVLHCFAEDYEYANACISSFPECKISFSGIVTFKNATKIQETAAKIPLSHIMIETDSPYLTPDPFRGKEENEPAYSQYVLKKICELRPEDNTLIEKAIFENTSRFFHLKT